VKIEEIKKEHYLLQGKSLSDKEVENGIIIDFIDFLNDGFKKTHLTNNLHSYLCLHGGFPIIAKKEKFYNEYFKESNFSDCNKKKKWKQIAEDNFLSENGQRFRKILFSKWSRYGSYSELNSTLQDIYVDFSRNISINLKDETL